MLTACGRPDADKALDSVDPHLQIRRREHQMVDGAEQVLGRTNRRGHSQEQQGDRSDDQRTQMREAHKIARIRFNDAL